MSEDLIDGLVRWLHVLAAVIFIGPQIFLAAVAMPAMRSIEDARVRQATVRRITRGFGMVGGIALAVLLATGIWQYYEFESLVDRDLAPRYFFLIQTKLTLVTIVIVLTVLHGAFFGRRLQQLQEQNAPESEIARARTWSMVASILNLAASIFIVLCATLMASSWSKL
jgi:copper resistance protein D